MYLQFLAAFPLIFPNIAESDLPGPHSKTFGKRSFGLDMNSDAMLDSHRTGLTICLGRYFLI